MLKLTANLFPGYNKTKNSSSSNLDRILVNFNENGGKQLQKEYESSGSQPFKRHIWRVTLIDFNIHKAL